MFMKDFLKVMRALSNSGRVEIIKLLRRKPLCVSEIRDALGLAQPTVSKHLKLLENAGLVTYVKKGLWVHYRLSDGQNNPYAAVMLGYLRHWPEKELKESFSCGRHPKGAREIQPLDDCKF